MSFSFSAMGTRDEVLAQLALSDPSGNKVGEAARDLVAAALEAEVYRPAGPGWEYRFIVEASGHSGGGSPLSLNLTVRPVFVRAADPPA